MKTKRKNIFKSLLALTLALIMVLGVAPINELAGVDWASLFAPKAEAAEVSDLPESFDLDVYSANIVFRDHESYEYGEFDYLQYCFNTIGSPAGNVYRIFSDNKDFVNSVEAYEAVKKVANPSNVLKDLNLQQRYEAVLYTVLFSSLYGEKLQKVSYSNAISDITGFTDKLINTPRTAVMFNKSSLDPDASDALKDTALAFITDGKDDKWASLSDYNGMVKKVSGSIDKVIGTATDIYNYAQKIGMYCALVDVGADAVRVLLDMKKNTTDVVLKSALQAVADSLSQDWYGVAEKVVLDVGFSVTDKAIKSLVEYGWLGCCEICPFLKGMMIGEKIGTAVCNLLFATDETIEQYEYLKIVTRIEDAAHAGLTKLGNAVDKNNNVVNASSFWFSLDFAATLYEESSNASIEFMYICCTKGLVNKIANFMGAGKDLSAEEFETSVNHCNELIQLHYGILRDSWRKYIGDDYPGFLLTLQKREAGFIPITSISVSKKNVTYYVGETAWAPSVTKNPSNANGGIAYKSDNEEVFASTTGFPIDEAKKAGTANVTVYSVDDPSIYDTFTVTVIEKNGETETKTDNGIIDSGTYGGNLTWKLTEAGTLIISGTGAMKNCSYRKEEYEIPWYSYRSFIRRAVIANSVTSIGDYAFSGCSSLTSATIPNSVTSIGRDAFYYCNSLTSVIIPDSVTSIGLSAFEGCSSLTSVTIPNGVKSIESFAFRGCSSLISVTIPDSVTSIEWGAFEDCSSLTSVKIGNGVKSIGDDAFNGCSNLTSVTIPDSVTSIGSDAFYGCSGLTSVTIPDSVTSIGSDAFKDCSSLTSVTIGNGVTSTQGFTFSEYSRLTSVKIGNGVKRIRDDAFKGCSNLTSVTIGNSVTSIGDYAFSGCSSLTSVTIPNGVMSIGECTFYDCSSLANVTIPDSVTSIGWAAFEGCGSLTSVMIGNSVTCIIDRAFKDCSSLTSVTIPDSVTSIGDYAFKDCSSLTSVTIGNNVTSIGWSAFEGCGSLESVTIPDSVTSIRGDTFSGCSSLTSVTIGNSVTSIASHAFYRCSSLTSITIPDSVTSIGEDVFWDCSSLESVTIGNSVTSIGDSAFHGCSGLKSVNYTGTKGDWCKISFGDRSFTANPVYYAKCLYVNGEDVGDVIIPNDVTRINPLTFYNCKNLTSITIPNSVTSIGEYAFYGCNSLTSVTIPDSVTSIEIYAFYDCDSLTGVTIPDGVTSIGEGTFKFCSSLTSVTIPDSVTSIGDGAFDGCNGLTSIIIPNSVTSIGDSAFEGCSGLTSITIPNSVTSIGNFALDGCTGLTSITIPNSVTSIENGAFFFCISLESVTIPDSVTSIGSSAFDYCKYLKDVYYCGTEAQWEKITIGDDNNCLTNATIHFNWKPCTHKWSSWQTVTAPTVDSEGLEKRVCSKCGAEETRAISKLEPVAVTSVKLNKSSKSLTIGDTFTLTATVKPNNATDKSVTWSSSNTSVATVDENGVVTAVAEGTATITATASNGVKADCTVTVKQKGDSIFKKIFNVILAPFRAIINLFKKLFGK